MFSIIIPTWNNLDLVKLCVQSIRQNSTYDHEIVLHINEGNDGTREWANTEGVLYTESSTNIGICLAVNMAFGKTTKPYIMYMNDDMFVLPNWDKALAEEINALGNQEFMLSATMIEPRNSNAPNVIVADYGRDVKNFQQEKLLANYKDFNMDDWSGASFPPLLVRRSAWLKIGGFSVEFSPGMYSDPDFSMKMWQMGCRIFKGVGRSRVYHFQCCSTGRVVKNDGRLQFMQKWRISANVFYKYFLRLGEPFAGYLITPNPYGSALLQARWAVRLKLLFK